MKNKKNDIKVGHVVLKHQREMFAPPPPGYPINSPFQTIHDWLSAICDAEPPAVPISVYSFGVFESADDWLLFVVGENSAQKDQYTSATYIDFKPSLMYFLLPKEQHAGKQRDEIKKQLHRELEEFTRTEKFRSSFLAKAYSAEWSGEAFWYQ